jgi:hypothetical protein
MSKINRSTTQARDGQVIVGIKKDLQNVSSLPLAASTYTMAALEQLIQSRIDAANAVANAKANWHDAMATYDALNTKVTEVVRGLRQYVINAFGQNSPVLADFGFTPPKKATLTPEQKVAKAAKAKATREARGTMGKKQKALIKGTVSTTAPATSPAAPAPTPAHAATPVPPVVTAPPQVLAKPYADVARIEEALAVHRSLQPLFFIECRRGAIPADALDAFKRATGIFTVELVEGNDSFASGWLLPTPVTLQINPTPLRPDAIALSSIGQLWERLPRMGGKAPYSRVFCLMTGLAGPRMIRLLVPESATASHIESATEAFVALAQGGEDAFSRLPKADAWADFAPNMALVEYDPQGATLRRIAIPPETKD